MLNFSIVISELFDIEWRNIFFKEKKLTKYKACGIQVYQEDVFFRFTFEYTIKQDHAGLGIEIGFVSYTINFTLFDIRHWNYDLSCFDTPDPNRPLF